MIRILVVTSAALALLACGSDAGEPSLGKAEYVKLFCELAFEELGGQDITAGELEALLAERIERLETVNPPTDYTEVHLTVIDLFEWMRQLFAGLDPDVTADSLEEDLEEDTALRAELQAQWELAQQRFSRAWEAAWEALSAEDRDFLAAAGCPHGGGGDGLQEQAETFSDEDPTYEVGDEIPINMIDGTKSVATDISGGEIRIAGNGRGTMVHFDGEGTFVEMTCVSTEDCIIDYDMFGPDILEQGSLTWKRR